MPTAQIYIKRTQAATWDTFKKYCENNGFSISEKIMEYVQTMADAHGDGGSQTYLTFAENPKTLPLYKTCKHSHKALSKGEFFCGKYATWSPPTRCRLCNDYREEVT